MRAKYFAHAALCAISLHCNADGRSRCDHTNARTYHRNWRSTAIRDGSFGRTPVPPEHKRTAILTASLLSRLAKITLPSQVLLGTETHGATRDTNVADSELESNDRQPLTSFTTAVGENFTATFSGLTGAIADFTGSL